MGFLDIIASLIFFFFIISFSVIGFYQKKFLKIMIFSPFDFFQKKRYFQLITGGFVHSSVGHLVLNLVIFYFFAFSLNNQIGNKQFFIIYFASLIGSHLITLLKNKKKEDFASLGASGALAGILFAFMLFNPETKLSLFFLPIGIPVPFFALGFLAYSFFKAKKKEDSRVNHESHLWGAVSGFITAFFLNYSYFIEKITHLLKS